MPRPAKPPRLILRPARADVGARWVILDRGREISTGAGPADLEKAEAALAAHIAGKAKPLVGPGDPSQVLIADVLANYSAAHADETSRPDLIGYAIDRLCAFFDVRPASSITPDLCARYVAWRTAQRDGRAKKSDGKPISLATARRELGVLGTALKWCWENNRIDRLIPIKKPEDALPRERYLTRSEAALLLAAALGWDKNGTRYPDQINRHLARFIVLGIYTGTRHKAMLDLQWMRNTTGGWVDLDGEVIYRRAVAAKESRKRKPPVPIAGKLKPHMVRWRRHSARWVIEYEGEGLKRKLRRSWHSARKLAGLGPDVLPHILRHTCATWLLQEGESVHDVAGVLGTSEDVVRDTYGHHAHDGLRRTVAAFSRRRNKA